MRTALSIAGSDSCGGAGIQADIKTMTMNGVYAMSAITALNGTEHDRRKRQFRSQHLTFLKEQLDAVFEDIYPDAVKIGMVSSSELIRVIAERLEILSGSQCGSGSCNGGDQRFFSDENRVRVQTLMRGTCCPSQRLLRRIFRKQRFFPDMTIESKEEMVTGD